MSEPTHLEGRCLCGRVTVKATASAPVLRACHCDMCRRHTSGAFVSIATDAGTAEIEGPASVYRSSDWAERGFCGTCGSTLWYQADEGDGPNLSAGLFSNAGDAVLSVEYFTDKCPQGYALAGDHKKLTTRETLALFAPEYLE